MAFASWFFWRLVNSGRDTTPGGVANAILLEDGTGGILLEDGSGVILMEG